MELSETTLSYQVVSNDTPTTTTTIRALTITIYSTEHMIATSIVLGLMILATIIGNVFVIAAVILERSLHNVANYLILSLAVADLMVATLVMPISVLKDISKNWFLPNSVCDMHNSFDVLYCTASILHLVAIAIDRYWAVTSIAYIRRRSPTRIGIMILLVWAAALVISIPPLFGWKPENNPEITGECVISQDKFYTVYSTVGAFYLPMTIMIIIYLRIYQVARARIRKEKFVKKEDKKKTKKLAAAADKTSSPKGEYSVVSCNGCSPEKDSSGLSKDVDNSDMHCATNGNSCDEANAAMLKKDATDAASKVAMSAMCRREKLELKRERKAARTLAIITGCFLICWLPFFIEALVMPFVKDKIHIPMELSSFFLWLGYFNSLMNPIIYTKFSPEFRNAFRKILFGKYSRKINR
ncbi:5-hydroxytryptamine receptor-like [Gigantopelta aegis]|uniref:5-hydroxytryptamine receptor-like n=1 Tax=Gigantopelta aegis TaxID=1735272 RepID=UPI001B889338|nr:5-hydroxytryptamine receptor-like [Gigantopelta aegis]